MAKGENIFKRKDGRWEARYIKGYDNTGKIKYGFCYGKTYKEAKEKVSKYKAAILNGNPIISSKSKQKFSYYCNCWLNSIRIRIKESTYVKYENNLINHIIPHLGHCDPSRLSSQIIESFTNDLLNKDKLSAKTVKDILVIVRSIIAYTRKQLPGCIPQMDIIYPKETKKQMRVLKKEELITLISYLNKDIDECKFGVLLTLNTGLRIGEICALKWENVYFDQRLIKISSTVQRLKCTNNTKDKTILIVSSPKSTSSFRIIPLSDSLFELCKKMNCHNPQAYILSGTTKIMEPRTLQYRFKKYMNECHIENIHFHCLRHTFATCCVEAGFEIKSLSEILGHSNTSITLNRYVHPSIELKRMNMEKIELVLHNNIN